MMPLRIALLVTLSLFLTPPVAAAGDKASSATRPAKAAVGQTKPAKGTVAAKSKSRPAPVGDQSAPQAGGNSYATREDVRTFAAEMAERTGLDVQWVHGQLAQARFLPRVAQLIMPSPAGTAKNWQLYRSRFIEPQRLKAGLAFWRDNEQWLNLAQERWGVPASVVMGIIGVETMYGQHMGTFRTLDALATLSFDFPTGRKDRTPFFRSELEAFLLMCHKEGVTPAQVKGSYAGALGMPQFMPSSVNQYAVDFNGDGHIDLHRQTADVIGSVAHYLSRFGWERGLPTHLKVLPPVDASERARLLAPDIVPSFSASDMAAAGAILEDGQPISLPAESKLALVELQNGDLAPSYIAGTKNFYVVTRYNWSAYYALAVIELGEALQAARIEAGLASP